MIFNAHFPKNVVLKHFADKIKSSAENGTALIALS